MLTKSIKAIFTNSEGCKLIGPIMIQRLAPKASLPVKSVANIKANIIAKAYQVALPLQKEKGIFRHIITAPIIPKTQKPSCLIKKL